jgi:hypothetical protein
VKAGNEQIWRVHLVSFEWLNCRMEHTDSPPCHMTGIVGGAVFTWLVGVGLQDWAILRKLG